MGVSGCTPNTAAASSKRIVVNCASLLSVLSRTVVAYTIENLLANNICCHLAEKKNVVAEN